MGCGNRELKPCSPSLSRESLNMAQDTLQWVVGADKCVVGADKCVYTELQDFEERWEPSGVPPQRCAAQEHLEMLPVHTKPAGYADT